MNITVKEGPLDLPVLQTDRASQVEIRDPEGYLVMFVRVLRDNRTILISMKEDEDFQFNAREHKIPMHVPPGTTTTSSGIIIG
jgi:hypothetical protein